MTKRLRQTANENIENRFEDYTICPSAAAMEDSDLDCSACPLENTKYKRWIKS
jgi:hypothetical protein